MCERLKTLAKQRYGIIFAILASPFIAYTLKQTVKHMQKNLDVMLSQDWS